MDQSYFLVHMDSHTPEHSGGSWAKSVESATRKYAACASDSVYAITGLMYVPSISKSPGIGPDHVGVPKFLFKLVYNVPLIRLGRIGI